MAEKIVLLEKMSKRQRKEHLRKNRVMFGHQQCTVPHKSAKDKNRRREKEELAALKRDWRVFDCNNILLVLLNGTN